MKVIAIVASHNRRACTLECLDSYFAQETAANVTLGAVLVDDGSVDDTARAVREAFPGVAVIVARGDLYWAGAMALAEEAAVAREPECILWLNDDVVLDRDALQRLIDTSSEGTEDCIAVGALRDPVTGELTYSGVRRRGTHPLRVDLVVPGEEPVAVETFNGNVVLVPRSVTATVGPIDGALVHAAADFDYGLRAGAAGVPRLLAPRTVGTCPLNTRQPAWMDRAVSPRQRLRRLLGPKGLPPRARARYLKRHGGPAWFVFWLAPYVRAAPSLMRPARSARVTR